jgi:hypothetical protein
MLEELRTSINDDIPLAFNLLAVAPRTGGVAAPVEQRRLFVARSIQPGIPLAGLGPRLVVEQNRLFAMRRIQPEIPVAGLVPAIHAFPAADRAMFEDVGGRNKSGHGGPKVVPVSSAPSNRCSKKPNRTAVDIDRLPSRLTKS